MSARLTAKYGINQENLATRRQFVRLGPEERALMLELVPFVDGCADEVVREFYDFQFSFAPTRAFFEEAARNKGMPLAGLREYLEGQQRRYLREVFEGARSNWDVDYFERRLATGRTHDRIDLPMKWYVGAYVEFLRLLRIRLSARYPAERVVVMVEVISRVFNYDTQAIGDSFVLNTLESLGLGVDAVSTDRKQDKTERIATLKQHVRTLLAQATAVAEDRLNDEVLQQAVPGRLGASFVQMIANMKAIAGQASALSRGELHADSLRALSAQGDDRVLGSAMRSIHRALGSLLSALGEMVQAAQNGELERRVDTTGLSGDYAEICIRINGLVDGLLKPIHDAMSVLDRLRNRDLRARMQGEYHGGHGELRDCVNATAQTLEEVFVEIFAQLGESARQISTSAGEIAQSSQSVADGASRQASALEQTSASLEQMAASTKQNAENTQVAKGHAQSMSVAAKKGGTAMGDMVTAMQDIRRSSGNMAIIIRDINDIAFQTNLLALNASVEAARAGEAGRGFAVVAEEVRNLALRSKDAARRTEELINTSVKTSNKGEAICQDVSRALGEIVDRARDVEDVVGNIAVASREQAKGIAQLNKTVVEMDEVTQHNAASAEESSGAAEELSDQARNLAHLIAGFQEGKRGDDQDHSPSTGPVGKSVRRSLQS